MSDPKKTEPDEELLEFLGGIDEVNDESQDEDFSEFLANTDIDQHRRRAQAKGSRSRVNPMSESRRFMPTRRAALAALFAVGLNLAVVGRSRAESHAAEPPVHTRVELAQRRGTEGARNSHGERWDTLPAEQQQRLVRGTRRWLAMTPEQRERAQGALLALAGTDARATRARAPALASLPRAAARAAAARARRIPQLQEAHAGAAPPPARALAERHAGRAAALAGAAPRASPAVTPPRTSYCVLGPAGGFGICFVLLPGLAQLITK